MDDYPLGDDKLDFVVEGILDIELKAAKNIDDAHFAQLPGRHRSTGLEHGLLINFGSYKFQTRNSAAFPKPSLCGQSTQLPPRRRCRIANLGSRSPARCAHLRNLVDQHSRRI